MTDAATTRIQHRKTLRQGSVGGSAQRPRHLPGTRSAAYRCQHDDRKPARSAMMCTTPASPSPYRQDRRQDHVPGRMHPGRYLPHPEHTAGSDSNGARIGCPNIVFPYLRETVSDVVIRAGFPPLLLNPVNFEACSSNNSRPNSNRLHPSKRIEADSLKLQLRKPVCNVGLLTRGRPAARLATPLRAGIPKHRAGRPSLRRALDLPPARSPSQAAACHLKSSSNASWVKVRDHSGRLAWIEKTALGGCKKRHGQDRLQCHSATPRA